MISNFDQVKEILSPSFNVMMAFFQAEVRPACAVRLRRALPRTLIVLTLVTLTLNSSCTACRICGLVARRSATTVYWLSGRSLILGFPLSSKTGLPALSRSKKRTFWLDCRVPFSVRRTVLMISKGFMLFFVQTGFDLFKRAPSEEEFVRAQHVVGVERIAGGQRNERQIACGQHEVLVHTGGNNQRRSVQFQGGNHLREGLGFVRSQFQVVHDHHVASLEPFAQRLAQRERTGFLGNFLREVARFGTENDATADPQRGSEGTGTGATGAFLLPRFPVRAGSFRSPLWVGGATALGRAIGDDGIVDGLRAFSVFNHGELHFEFALIFSFEIFNGNFHGSLFLGSGFRFGD